MTRERKRPISRVTEDHYKMIRMLLGNPEASKSSIARVVGLSEATVIRVSNASTWEEYRKGIEALSKKYEDDKNKYIGEEKPDPSNVKFVLANLLEELGSKIDKTNELLVEIKDKKRGFIL